jgi:hypothetical protein
MQAPSNTHSLHSAPLPPTPTLRPVAAPTLRRPFAAAAVAALQPPADTTPALQPSTVPSTAPAPPQDAPQSPTAAAPAAAPTPTFASPTSLRERVENLEKHVAHLAEKNREMRSDILHLEQLVAKATMAATGEKIPAMEQYKETHLMTRRSRCGRPPVPGLAPSIGNYMVVDCKPDDETMLDIHVQRDQEARRVFFRFARTPQPKKLRWKLPKSICGQVSKRVIEIVPLSVLVNQCLMRKIFRPWIVKDGSLRESATPEKLVVACIASLPDLWVLKAEQVPGVEGVRPETMLVLSAREARLRGLHNGPVWTDPGLELVKKTGPDELATAVIVDHEELAKTLRDIRQGRRVWKDPVVIPQERIEAEKVAEAELADFTGGLDAEEDDDSGWKFEV